MKVQTGPAQCDFPAHLDHIGKNLGEDNFLGQVVGLDRYQRDKESPMPDSQEGVWQARRFAVPALPQGLAFEQQLDSRHQEFQQPSRVGAVGLYDLLPQPRPDNEAIRAIQVTGSVEIL
jgi:hypothetical protein